MRSVRIGDLDRLAALEEEGFPSPWPRHLLAESLRAETALGLVAETHGRIVGYALFQVAAGEGELLRLVAARECRRRGIGRALLRAGLRRLSSPAPTPCHLEVREDEVAARALYEAEGFRIVGRRRGYYPDGTDALLYRFGAP